MFEQAIQQWVEDWEARRDQADKFEALKDSRAVESLLDRLSADQDHYVRRAIIIVLARFHFANPEVIRELVLSIADPVGTVGEEARTALANIDPNWLKSQPALEAVPDLITLLQHPEPYTRSRAAVTLGMIGDRRAIEPLVMMAREPTGYVRSAASNALRKIEGKISHLRW